MNIFSQLAKKFPHVHQGDFTNSQICSQIKEHLTASLVLFTFPAGLSTTLAAFHKKHEILRCWSAADLLRLKCIVPDAIFVAQYTETAS